MASRTPIPVARAMRNIAQHMDLSRRQQRITLELLAERADLSVPTVRKLLVQGKGSLETFLRVARVLGTLDSVVSATDPLNTPIGRLRADDDAPKRVRS
ncbi:toxin-antitoxin system, antitoxin component, Xre family [Bifidobacterium lemurum]|uniref:Toxin-antitoxin system, antitoxin component, Xre family n=1 Tax=Bifidobacterium lemurum TaxID=1603886 RepID=A0A261FW06_9BIFI|nr:helix-turn-helix transcriptional regulator [Bifidobacterium lemurum]OZG63357.1 toxin-antitoxin system, antitoxin component, Xre family [Bifidobacterium lemurum]QOL34267.1 helix-turn-helix transcriptional regulator [Bifidobacterium lemurum]